MRIFLIVVVLIALGSAAVAQRPSRVAPEGGGGSYGGGSGSYSGVNPYTDYLNRLNNARSCSDRCGIANDYNIRMCDSTYLGGTTYDSAAHLQCLNKATFQLRGCAASCW